MLSKYKYKKITWIDLESPTNPELQNVAEEFNLPEEIVQDILTKNSSQKSNFYNGSTITHITLNIPNEENEKSAHFIIGNNFLITSRHIQIEKMNLSARMFDQENFSAKENLHALVAHLMRDVYDHAHQSLTKETAKKLEEKFEKIKKEEKKNNSKMLFVSATIIIFIVASVVFYSVLK